MKKVFAPFILN